MRFLWELEVCISRLCKLGVSQQDIIILLTDINPRYADRLRASGCAVHSYVDRRDNKTYIPSIRPYLWYQYLQEDRQREQEDYFYIDSDVLFTAIPDVRAADTTWYASDCNSYIGNGYIDSKGEYLLKNMADVIGIDQALIRRHEKGAGAHWVISKPTAAYWRKVYSDSVKLYAYLSAVENEYIAANAEGYVPIQKWTAEMWAQLWNAYSIGIDVQIHKELNFVFATDTRAKAETVKIIHNAGVLFGDRENLFYKSDYQSSTPYGADLSYVDKDSASWVYVQGIKEVKTMTGYRVIQGFRDKTDNEPYFVGDQFPKQGNKKVPANRLKFLIGAGLIEKVEDKG